MFIEIADLYKNLKEAYTAENLNLIVLQVLDISFNDVDDLSPLFELGHLNYLNVMGNRIPPWQLEKLQLKGVTVVQ